MTEPRIKLGTALLSYTSTTNLHNLYIAYIFLFHEFLNVDHRYLFSSCCRAVQISILKSIYQFMICWYFEMQEIVVEVHDEPIEYMRYMKRGVYK